VSWRVIVALAVALAIGSIATGCGLGDSSDPAPTKAAFVKRGDAICEKIPSRYLNRYNDLREEQKGKSLPPKAAKEEQNLKSAVPPLRTATAEFEELGAPEGDEEQVEAIIAALEKGADGIEADPGSELSGPKSPLASFAKLTGENGLKACQL
jgi:hypothetical protein